MAYIHMYKDNPTAGETDGIQVSEQTENAPVTVTLTVAGSDVESGAIKLALRCESGYQTSGDTTITPTGDSSDKWALAPDNGGSPGTFGSYGDSLTISDTIGATNYIFWAKAKALASEDPQNDATVDLKIDATIEAV